MEYIIKEIPECKLEIISNLKGINKQQYFVENINLEKNIKFIGYIAAPDKLFKNVSLSFFPSISEAFPMVLVETKIYGIPNILLGLDYVKLRKEDKKINEKEAVKIIENQIKLLRMRDHNFLNVTSKNFENYIWMEQINLR